MLKALMESVQNRFSNDVILENTTSASAAVKDRFIEDEDESPTMTPEENTDMEKLLDRIPEDSDDVEETGELDEDDLEAMAENFVPESEI